MNDIDDLNLSFLSCVSDDFASAESDSSVTVLHDQISCVLSNLGCNFNVVHINAQSLPAHYTDVVSSFSDTSIDAVLISESFLKPSLPSALYPLPGYQLIRNDRTGKGGGGVAIYLRSDIPFKIISSSPNNYSESAEYLLLQVIFHHSKVLLAVFYSPSLHIDYFSDLENILNDFLPLHDHTLLIGDFNTCLIKNDFRSRKLLSLLTSFNLHVLPLSATHQAPHCSASLLDLLVVSCLDAVALHGQLSSCFSYHDLIYLSFKVRPPKRKPKYVSLRSYKGIVLEELQADAAIIDWSSVFLCDDMEVKIVEFNRCLLSLFDKHAPFKRVKVKHFPAPWLNDDIKRVMVLRNRAKVRYKRLPSESNLLRYKLLRNRCSRMCRDAKRRYFHSSIQGSSAEQLWRFLKSQGIGKSSVSSSVSFDVNVVNKHFTQQPFLFNSLTKAKTLSDLSSSVPSHSPFTFMPVDEASVRKHILSISSQAVGHDNVCSKMIVPIVDVLLPVLTHLFNFSLVSGTFPSIWKKAHVIPLPKIANPTSPSHFRPISILPFLSKVLEHIVHKQLSAYLDTNNLLCAYQSGFRPGHSTVTALLKVTDDIRWAMDERKVTILVLLDFSSAFNSVDFDLLVGVLRSLNILSPALDWFDSYLRGRSQCTLSEESCSEWCALASGVPQGCVLSPLLFSVFINTVTYCLSSRFHLYADDLQLYTHFTVSEADVAVSNINRDLSVLSSWAASFGLLINPSKSQAIVIGSRYMCGSIDFSSLPSVIYNGSIIPYTFTAKNLGVFFDQNLSWTTHVDQICKRVYAAFHALKRLQNFLPFNTKVQLSQTLLLSLIDYADCCFLDITEELLGKLERLQNLAIRFVFDLRKYDHVSEFRRRLKWLTIRHRRNCHILCTLYKVLHGSCGPSYLRDCFSFLYPPNKPCRSHVSTLLHIPLHHSNFGSRSFSVHAVRLWNELPADIRSSKSFYSFKKKVKNHYLSLSQ